MRAGGRSALVRLSRSAHTFSRLRMADEEKAAAAKAPKVNADRNGSAKISPSLDAELADGLGKLTMGRLPDKTWGPTGLYGSRVAENKLLSLLRTTVRPKRLHRIESVLLARCKRVQCLFENVSDPANGAACLRTMESFGLTDAHVVEAYEPFRVAGGITMSAEKWMDVTKHKHCLDAVDQLKGEGFTLVATCLDEDAVPIEEVDFEAMEKICLMFGNEERGLSKALRRNADVKAYIRMSGFSQSFNISVSCSLMMMHMRHLGIIQPDLTDEDLTKLYKKWLLMSSKKAITLLKRHNLLDEAEDYL